MKLRANRKTRARVEMVPLIDTVFLLLVFFMYAMLTMTVHRGVKVELPEAGTPEPELPRHVTVSIDKQGALSVEGRPTTMERLVTEVEGALGKTEQRKVVIDGDRNSDLGTGVKVLEKLSHIEDVKVSFSVREEK
ncbi:MAG: biopolymer transporter ExbD [Planctomycetes bacterium]|nr:biopolymer transporter ExbD [Planctomycetota bacterium]